MVEKSEITSRITPIQVVNTLRKLRDKEVAGFYTSESDDVTCMIDDPKSVAAFLSTNRPIAINFVSREVRYTLSDSDVVDEIFDIDISSSFSQSDIWLYDKISNVSLVFPTAVNAALSAEQRNFYICIIIASVLGEVYIKQLMQVVNIYDFDVWMQTDSDVYNFTELYTKWIQYNSSTIRMVASAARYALAREGKKKEIPAVLGLSEEKVLKLRNLERAIGDVRYQYDEIKMSPSERMKLTSLDVKNLCKERELEVIRLKNEDMEIKQLYDLTKLNSKNIDPITIQEIATAADEQAPVFFKEIVGRDATSREDKIEVRKISTALIKEANRAVINKIFAEEAVIYIANPSTYKAPDFL